MGKLENLESFGVLKKDERKQAEDIFATVLSSLDRRYPISLSHRDLSPQNNILFTRDFEGGPSKVTGVIDFEQAASVPGPVFEIAMIGFYQQAYGREVDFNSFLSGMGIEPSDYYGTQLERDCDAALLLRLCPEVGWLKENMAHDYVRLYRSNDLMKMLITVPELIKKLST